MTFLILKETPELLAWIGAFFGLLPKSLPGLNLVQISWKDEVQNQEQGSKIKRKVSFVRDILWKHLDKRVEITELWLTPNATFSI